MDQPTLDLIIEMRKDYDKLMNPNPKGMYLRQDIFQENSFQNNIINNEDFEDTQNKKLDEVIMNATDRENLKLFRRYNPEVRISNS